MKRHAETAADQFGDASRGPQVGGEVVGRRLLSQPAPNLQVLFGGKKSRPSRRRLGNKTGLAFGAASGHPLGDRNGMYAEHLGNGGLRLAAQHILNGQSSYRFQCSGSSFASHTTKHSKAQLP
jgi:hypothetical protein